MKALTAANGQSYGMDHRGNVDLAAASVAADVFHFKNAHVGMTVHPAARGVHMVRNPLAVVVSAYFSHLKTHKIQPISQAWVKLARQRDLLQGLPKSDGLTATIAFLCDCEFYPATPGPLHALANWD